MAPVLRPWALMTTWLPAIRRRQAHPALARIFARSAEEQAAKITSLANSAREPVGSLKALVAHSSGRRI